MYERLGPEKGELVRNMAAGAASSTVMQCFTVPLDIVGQARSRRRGEGVSGRGGWQEKAGGGEGEDIIVGIR